ncbi:MAG TPA: DMT family transporter [Methylomirabilota bacterium]|nr:DMT family transporter [Methylomirabilota bacterium]
MRTAYLVLFAANLVYATSYVATRLVLDDLPPALLALLRCVVGGAILVPVARVLEPAAPPARGDAWRIAWMGVFGFAAAFALGSWGIAHSTATNAALLIIVEPFSIMLLGPAVLGERLTRREKTGAALALGGTVIVVLNGVPGLTHALAPHWRGDLLLVLSGLAYGSYSLIGRDVLLRRGPLDVTARSITWGALAVAPLAAAEWLAGSRPAMTAGGIIGALYLGLIITAGGYLLWNWALGRVEASRAAVFITVQPIGGALLGVLFLHETLTLFTLAGGALVVAGLWLTATGQG